MIEYVFAPEVQRYNITIHPDARIEHAVFVTAYPWGAYRMSTQVGLHGLPLLEAVALQIGRIVLGHDFQRSGYKAEKRNRKEWRQAEAWAACRLVPDRAMRLARRLGQDPRDIARDLGLSERFVIVRYNLWHYRRGQLLELPPPFADRQVAWASDP